MNDPWLSALKAFCRSDCDRGSFIARALDRYGAAWHSITTENLTHYCVQPPGESTRRLKILLAHYDRYPGSPGANDNSAAVLSLLACLPDILKTGDTGVIFTDGEELHSGRTVEQQGSCLWAKTLREEPLEPLIIVMDLCGIGDTPVWSAMNVSGKTLPEGEFHEIISKREGRQCYRLPLIFSDNLGLHRGGLGSFQLSLLPRKEAREFHRSLLDMEELEPECWSEGAYKKMEALFPVAWKRAHTSDDSPEHTQKGSFLLLTRIIRDLASWQPQV